MRACDKLQFFDSLNVRHSKLIMSILPSDFTSVIWGIAIGVFGAFGAGFLKKAGEECYSWIRNKVSPKSPDQHAPQVVIQVTKDSHVLANGEPIPKELEPTSIERVSSITIDEIREAIGKAPPLQQKHVASSYVGLRVEWDAYFNSGTRHDNDMVSLILKMDTGTSQFITCEVPFNEYRELGVLPAGSKLRVAGEIAVVDSLFIALKDARLLIYGK